MKRLGLKRWAYVLLAMFLASASLWALDLRLTLNEGEGGSDPGDVAETVEILFVLTFIGLVPSILILMTSFTRIIIVLGFLRRALGLQTMPPDQVLVGMTLFLSLFIMWPTFERMYQEAYVPYKAQDGTDIDFQKRFLAPLRDFMFEQTRKSDLQVMLDLAKVSDAKTRGDVPTQVLIPAFVISELTRAFEIGFYIYLPFFLVDMVVAAVLMSMGMMMLPPVMISLPFKILLFVLVDGWALLVVNLVAGFA